MRRADRALDAKSADDALNLLEILRSELGKTIIMVTHDLHAAARKRSGWCTWRRGRPGGRRPGAGVLAAAVG
ncbi:MAG: hypothetical protein U0871_22655 [Gemmataceae bacterium]